MSVMAISYIFGYYAYFYTFKIIKYLIELAM